MFRTALATLLVVVVPQVFHAQDFFYPPPPPVTVTATRDELYHESGSTQLRMDVYRHAKSSGTAPALIFFNQTVGARRTAFTMYARWGELAAAKGLVAIVPDLRPDSSAADFRQGESGSDEGRLLGRQTWEEMQFNAFTFSINKPPAPTSAGR